jgi:exodeoxyribonuclease-3
MKIISWNVNGLRAVHKKGDLKNFLEKFSPEIICFQEIKAKPDQLTFLEEEFPDYTKWYHSADKAGYAGTGIWIKNSTLENFTDIEFFEGFDETIDFHDNEGRISRLHYTDKKSQKKFALLGVYFPNGGKSEDAWGGEAGKLVFYKKFLEKINMLRAQGREVIFCGDVNTCHEAIDIARPKANDGKIGFHPLERAELSRWVANGWVDVWRKTNPTLADQYSWWSYRGGARSRNVGWRIDYFFVDEKFFPEIKNIEYLNEQMGSDHCPVLMEI